MKTKPDNSILLLYHDRIELGDRVIHCSVNIGITIALDALGYSYLIEGPIHPTLHLDISVPLAVEYLTLGKHLSMLADGTYTWEDPEEALQRGLTSPLSNSKSGDSTTEDYRINDRVITTLVGRIKELLDTESSTLLINKDGLSVRGELVVLPICCPSYILAKYNISHIGDCSTPSATTVELLSRLCIHLIVDSKITYTDRLNYSIRPYIAGETKPIEKLLKACGVSEIEMPTGVDLTDTIISSISRCEVSDAK